MTNDPVLPAVDPSGPPVPPGVDPSVPSPARMYDYVLGGSYNYPSDRAATDQGMRLVPEGRDIVFALRGFHGRAVAWMGGQGITQFLDIGSGLPTVGNTHEIVARINPAARVMYADNDPMVAACTKDLLVDPATTRFVIADMRDPDDMLTRPEISEFIDFTQPLGLILCAVLHFVADEDDPVGLMDRYIAALAPGSMVALSHVTADKAPYRLAQAVRDSYDKARERIHFRSRAEVERFFAGLELVPPYDGAGSRLAYLGEWGAEDPDHADSDGSRWGYCGIGRKL